MKKQGRKIVKLTRTDIQILQQNEVKRTENEELNFIYAKNKRCMNRRIHQLRFK